ncbi:MAG: 1-deoxy-D-xylulose-5-phosphate reductoisomerase, partial [Gammaproteobacteria bacterium]|nr:1-deoxy-D-xylulose-5-phosphate reductoisomerase [Gammaproteobacteria bacterium]
MIGLTLLGATGSIGLSTLDVVSRHKDKYEIVALTANRNIELLAEQCETWKPKYAVIAEHDLAESLRTVLINKGLDTEVLSGAESLQYVAALPEVHYVMAAIVGAAGLLPTLAAAKAGKRVLLANKESLVMSGKDAIRDNRDKGAELLPIDSEHNAIFQSMPSLVDGQQMKAGVTKILLTASGGPFRTRNIESLCDVTPEQAVAHPNWVMGQKISVDS